MGKDVQIDNAMERRQKQKQASKQATERIDLESNAHTSDIDFLPTRLNQSRNRPHTHTPLKPKRVYTHPLPTHYNPKLPIPPNAPSSPPPPPAPPPNMLPSSPPPPPPMPPIIDWSSACMGFGGGRMPK